MKVAETLYAFRNACKSVLGSTFYIDSERITNLPIEQGVVSTGVDNRLKSALSFADYKELQRSEPAFKPS